MGLSSLFSNIKKYEPTWVKVDEVMISAEDAAQFSKAEVVSGDYGLSAKLTMKETGEALFIQMDSKNSWSIEGDELDLTKCSIVTLKKTTPDGDKYIQRFVG